MTSYLKSYLVSLRAKENLRAFLNAILYNNIGNIKDIEIIKDKELTTDEITNKTGIIDVLAKIDDGTHINIEVQLTDKRIWIEEHCFIGQEFTIEE